MTNLTLRSFQRRFVTAVHSPDIDTAVLSTPRGAGKSWLAGRLVASSLTPGRRLFVRDSETILTASSLDQARIVFRFAKAMLGEKNYRYLDSAQRIAITHLKSDTRLRVMSSDAKRALGIVGSRLVVCDEPGAWEVRGGLAMHDAIQTAMGKNEMAVVYLGTIAPADPGGWWPELATSESSDGRFVMLLQGDKATWDSWKTIRKCNPLVDVNPLLRRTLERELAAAKRDDRLKARFQSFRLNIPSCDESKVLMPVDDWELVLARAVSEPVGRPVVGVDMGGSRAWSSAVAWYRDGLVRAMAVAPGVPSLQAQEDRDLVPSGTYRALAAVGSLDVDEGLRVVTVSRLIDRVLWRWKPSVIVCDRFRLPEVQDAVNGRCPVESRVTRWSSAAEDIRALRRRSQDGPMSIEIASRGLLSASLAVAVVDSDDQGSVRLVKGGTHNRARDDAAAAMVLAAGAMSRAPAPSPALGWTIARR